MTHYRKDTLERQIYRRWLYDRDLTPQQVGERFGIDEGSARVYLSKARRKYERETARAAAITASMDRHRRERSGKTERT